MMPQNAAVAASPNSHPFCSGSKDPKATRSAVKASENHGERISDSIKANLSSTWADDLSWWKADVALDG